MTFIDTAVTITYRGYEIRDVSNAINPMTGTRGVGGERCIIKKGGKILKEHRASSWLKSTSISTRVVRSKEKSPATGRQEAVRPVGRPIYDEFVGRLPSTTPKSNRRFLPRIKS